MKRSELKAVFYTCTECNKLHYGDQRKFDKHINYADISPILTDFNLSKLN